MQITAKQLRGWLGGLLITGTVAAVAVVVSASSVTVTPIGKRDQGDPGWQALQELLGDLKRAWHPRDRERILEEARPRAADYSPPLRRLLSDPGHELAERGIEVTAALRIGELRPALVEIAWSGPKRVRSAAVRSAGALGPWRGDELAVLLMDPSREVRCVAFEVALRSDDAPWRELFELLVEESREFQSELVAVLPDELPAEAIPALLEVLGEADPEDAVGLIAAMGRGQLDARAEAILLPCLEGGDPQVIAAALEALARKQSPLTDPGDVWRVVRDGNHEDRLRAKALSCLEKTGSFDAAQVRSSAVMLPPWTRYFAARCLLRAGDTEAIPVLLDLIHEEPGLMTAESGAIALPEDGEAQAVAVASRRLLAWLSGLSPASAPDEFLDWYFGSSLDWNPRYLPVAPGM